MSTLDTYLVTGIRFGERPDPADGSDFDEPEIESEITINFTDRSAITIPLDDDPVTTRDRRTTGQTIAETVDNYAAENCLSQQEILTYIQTYYHDSIR